MVHIHQIQRTFHRIHDAVPIAVQLVKSFLRNFPFPGINLSVMIPIQARDHPLRPLEHSRMIAFQAIREIVGNWLLVLVWFGKSFCARARLLLLNNGPLSAAFA